ncbi:uncharacterized protein LOC117175354 [Belonocnema kinseyi]|uniref:uncharacterized protein LOC117175354 n=1 Tax=Belonocnema kinseyi TaxID=2817044 RepID=UPI00143DA501|nr:uncharacterized protein LOC117175354 [Belonocnema kinseyi]
MIRKALAGATFALGNLSASSRRVINIRPRFISNLTISERGTEKDEGFSSPLTSPEETHKKLLAEMENLVNSPEMDLNSCMEFLRKSTYFYQPNHKYTFLKDLQSELSFELLCDNLCNTTIRMTYPVAIYILIRLCKLEISSINPLIVMRYWHRHIDPNIKFLKYLQIEMLLVHVLERMANTSWTESKKNLLVRRLRTKILVEELEKLSTSSIISAMNLMHTFGIVDIRVSEIFIKSLMSQNPPDWLQIFRILCTLDHILPGYEPMLEEAKKHIYQNIMEIPLWSLIEILRCIKDKVWRGSCCDF